MKHMWIAVIVALVVGYAVGAMYPSFYNRAASAVGA